VQNKKISWNFSRDIPPAKTPAGFSGSCRCRRDVAAQLLQADVQFFPPGGLSAALASAAPLNKNLKGNGEAAATGTATKKTRAERAGRKKPPAAKRAARKAKSQ
jgi:hypothetical protein